MVTPEQAEKIVKKAAVAAVTVGAIVLGASYAVEQPKPTGALTLEDIYSD